MAALPPVLVIGAGVIGLSAAVTLAETGHPVLVRTAEPPAETTSAVAGALWGPWLVKPRARVLRWAEHTLTTLHDLAAHPGTGVRLASGIEVSDLHHDPPDWAHLLPDRRPCTPIPDQHVHPIRGHHVIVTNPGLTDFIEADTGDSPDLTAIYPHPHHVVLGGTAEPDTWDRDPDPATGHAILNRCIRLEPRLADTQIIDHIVGLRPTRPHIRVDLQHHPSGTKIAHNYGHGGAGVSLSWGCAQEITEWLSSAEQPA